MKKKTKELKKFVKWFFTKTDRSDENFGDCTNLYELVEKLQYRVDDLENEHMILLQEIRKMQQKSES